MSKQELEERLSHYYGKQFASLTSRGATAIYLVLCALGKQGGQVIVPSITCPAAIYPIVAAGYVPVFCDVSAEDFNTGADQISAMEFSGQIAACLAVHSFGHKLDIKKISDLAKSRGVFLIEDVCQFHGEEGSEFFGDAIICSFGHTKIVDAGGGGAVLTDESSLAERIEEERNRLSSGSDDGNSYRTAYYALKDLSDEVPKTRALFRHLGECFETDFVKQAPENPELHRLISEKLETVAAEIELRRQRYARYREELSDLPVRFANPRPGSIPWRFTFCVDSKSEQCDLLTNLRSKGVHASSWYRALHQDWGETPGSKPTAHQVENTVVNLWLSEGCDESYITRSINGVKEYFGEKKS